MLYLATSYHVTMTVGLGWLSNSGPCGVRIKAEKSVWILFREKIPVWRWMLIAKVALILKLSDG